MTTLAPMSRLASLPALLPLVLALAGAGCAGPNLASQIARAPEFDPEDQSKCGVTKSQARPLIVEWPSADRAALESQARRGLVAVRYVGCEMEVLRQCRAPGQYAYTGITLKRDRVTMRDADELYANIPAYAAKFEGKLAKSGELDVAMTIVGTYEAERGTIGKDELEGECGAATHVVTALTAGAFEFFAGADADVSAEAQVISAGAGARSKSQRELLNQDGDDAACERATSKDSAPPEGCGALLRVEVVPLVEGKGPGAGAPLRDRGMSAAGGASSEDAPPALAGAPDLPSSAPGGEVDGCPSGMARVPGGGFKLGGARDVSVGAYCMDVTEVTADAFAACVQAGGCAAEGLTCGPGATYGAAGKGSHPLNCVDAAQAAAYCEAKGKRLPTEEEWEWAARGEGRGFMYPWGDDAPGGQVCWGIAGKSATCAVGSNPRSDNPRGIHDLVGNVWEWTATGFEGRGGLRVIRGGSFADMKADLLAAAKRIPNRPTDRNVNLGFRCVKTL